MFRPILAALLFAFAFEAQAALTLSDIQHEWAKANYQLEEAAQLEALEALAAATGAAVTGEASEDPAVLIWDGIVKSSLAGKKGGLGALSLVKAARRSLEKALELDPRALEGSAYTSLGALYYQVPGWPVAFGSDDKAREMLEQALRIAPDGIDSNYFYGDFLLQQKDYDGAREALERALAAPARPDRPVADSGRRAEIRTLLAQLPSS
ncbi:MAG: tetratricopeptide repeat protein [Halieaceae bacterium]|jgi:tetratricopeptide (TPR) repeat protein|nr:tetratricopeptide repeat protein [Halieaceae bacterium]